MSLFLLHFIEMTAVFLLLVWAFYLPIRAGLFYNGAPYCMAIGGYFAAYVTRDCGWPFWGALIVAVILGGLAAFLPGIGLSRAGGFAVAMASIALIFIIQSVINNLAFLGGAPGFFNIPPVEHLLPITYCLLLIVGIIVYRIENSPFGRAIEVMRVDAEAAAALGINTVRLSLIIQTITGAICALAGALYAFSMGVIFSISFGFNVLLFLWVVLFISGQYTMWGAIIFVPLLLGLSSLIPGEIAEYTEIIYGSLLVLVLILRPQGAVTRDLVRSISTNSKVWLSRLGDLISYKRG